MENLSISDSGPAGAPPAPGGPQLAAPQQLPPQMFTTAAQLLDLTDSKGLPPHRRRGYEEELGRGSWTV